MFDLIQSTARLFLIGCVGLVLAFAGFVLSILAYIKEVIDGRNPRRVSLDDRDVVTVSESTSRPHDRVSRPHHSRTPRARHDPSESSGDHSRPLESPRARRTRSHPQSLATPPSSPQVTQMPSPTKESEQRNGSRKRRLLKVTREISAGDSSVASPLNLAVGEVNVEVTTPIPSLRPLRALSDLSSAQSSEHSTGSFPSGEEHLPVSGRQVLKKIKDHHSQLRERCLNRAQSMPIPKSSARSTRRTDPYQAPYFFPTPMSPAAATYIQEVVSERQGTYPQPMMDPAVVIESNGPTGPLVASPTRDEPEKVVHHTPPPSPLTSPSRSQAKAEALPPPRRHRWSWHMPHLPLHHHSHERQRSVDDGSQAQEKGGAMEHKEILAKLKFDHHRRRHGSGSDDVRTMISSKAA